MSDNLSEVSYKGTEKAFNINAETINICSLLLKNSFM